MQVTVRPTLKYAPTSMALLALIALSTGQVLAQQGMGVGNNNPQEMLDVSGAIKLGTTTNTNAGTIRWTGTEFQGWDGTQWITFGGGGGVSVSLDDAYDNGSTITADAGPVTIAGPDGIDVTGSALIGGDALIFGNAEIGNDAFIGGNADILGTLNLPNGAAADYIAVSDATGAVTWTDPATITTGDDGDWTVNGTDISNANTGNVGIGTNAPTEILDVNGQIRMRTGATSGYVPASDANGVMIWTDPNTLVTPTTTIFANTSGVTSNENGTYATDDFVFGSPQLAYNGVTSNNGLAKSCYTLLTFAE